VVGIGGALMGGGLFFARVLLVSLKQQSGNNMYFHLFVVSEKTFALNPEANYYDY
jgi:hypothetical protein